VHEKLPGSGRFQAWTLESRTRYALVWAGVNALVVLGLGVLLGSLSVQHALLLAIPAVLVGALVHGWLWYPRAKPKLITPPRES
jgi:hypothetical protein